MDLPPFSPTQNLHTRKSVLCHLLSLLYEYGLGMLPGDTKTQAIVCLNQGGDLQYMKVEYSMAFEHEAQRKGKKSNAAIVSRQQREKKWQMQAFASRPTLHLGHANLARNQGRKKQINKETNKKQGRSGKQNYFQSGDLTVKVH